MKPIRLVRGIAAEDFLQVICRGSSNRAARFILDWASDDMESAAQFMAGFIAKVFRELDVGSPYLSPKPGTETSFGGKRTRPSVSYLYFEKFCELLIENPELIKRFRKSSSYPTDRMERRWFFGNREASPLALTRGITWDAPGFKDSRPVPLHLKLKYQDEQKQNQERSLEAQKVREAGERKHIEEKRQERRAESQSKSERRKRESALRKIKWT